MLLPTTRTNCTPSVFRKPEQRRTSKSSQDYTITTYQGTDQLARLSNAEQNATCGRPTCCPRRKQVTAVLALVQITSSRNRIQSGVVFQLQSIAGAPSFWCNFLLRARTVKSASHPLADGPSTAHGQGVRIWSSRSKGLTAPAVSWSACL